MDNPTDAVFDAITEAAEEAIANARKRQEVDAVNWSDAHVSEVLFCINQAGEKTWRVVIEEAAPGCRLGSIVWHDLAVAFPGQTFDVGTEW